MSKDINRTAVYEERVRHFKILFDNYSRRLKTIGLLRLLFFALFGWEVVEAFRATFSGNHFVWAMVMLGLFIGLLFISFGFQRLKQLNEQLLRINENELRIHEGGRSFLSDGADVANLSGYGYDLNVFGQGSLYHVLNRTATVAGRTTLARRLLKPLTKGEEIVRNQHAVAALAPCIDFRQAMLAKALLMGKEEGFQQLKEGIVFADYSLLEKKVVRMLAWFWPTTGALLLFYSIAVNQYQLLLLFLVTGLLVAGLLVKYTGGLYNHISRRSYLYTRYADSFALVTAQHFEDPHLRSLQQKILHASDAFKRLSRIVSWYDARLNFLLSPFINGLFLSDLLCARAYLRWSKTYQQQVPAWFDTLGEIECLNSLAAFYYNHPAFVFPEPVSGAPLVHAKALGHPLMDERLAVRNDVTLGIDGKLHLITGSNMAGKSTYLRTTGLNVLLAQTGAPVFAESFRFTPVQLLTSFHHIDSLEEGSSYFHAELKSLQSIMQSLDNPLPSLVLLDEVMRGTNSKDKHDGTALLIQKLLSHNCLTMIATHDTALGVLAGTHNGIRNFCFESEITSDGLHFDFKRKAGVAHTTNATYLMKKMGIV